MTEILLQTIVEKLEALEIALQKENNLSTDEAMQEQLLQHLKSFQSGIEKIISQLDNNNVTLNNFSKDISALKLNLNKDIHEEVKHIHHFHKLVWVTVSLFIISILFAYGWINCSIEKKAFEANDIKYRYWKVDENASLLKLAYYTDSLYHLDKDGFIQQVIQAEQHGFQRLVKRKSVELKAKTYFNGHMDPSNGR